MTDMHEEIRRLEPLVATAIAERDRVKAELEEQLRGEGLEGDQLKGAVWVALGKQHPELEHAVMIAEMREEGLSDERIAQELSLVEAQGMW